MEKALLIYKVIRILVTSRVHDTTLLSHMFSSKMDLASEMMFIGVNT